MTTIDQQLFELMCRAPAEIPNWFTPDMSAFESPVGVAYTPEESKRKEELMRKWNDGYKAQRFVQWPSAYARMVMEAAGKGEA